MCLCPQRSQIICTEGVVIDIRAKFPSALDKCPVQKLKSTIICVTYCPDDSPLSSFKEVLKPTIFKPCCLTNRLQS